MSKKKPRREQEPPVEPAAEAAADPSPAPDAEPAAGSAAEPDPLDELRRERDDLHDRWLRAAAELDNVRKRARREVAEARRLAEASLLRDMLEVVDNFERAAAALPPAADDEPADTARLRSGLSLIESRFQEILAGRGLSRIEAGPGVVFDPNLHEAVLQVESEEHASGLITEVAQPGYRLDDMVLRPSRVVVAR